MMFTVKTVTVMVVSVRPHICNCTDILLPNSVYLKYADLDTVIAEENIVDKSGLMISILHMLCYSLNKYMYLSTLGMYGSRGLYLVNIFAV